MKIRRHAYFEADIGQDRITYRSYPFFPTSLVQRPVLEASQIAEINPHRPFPVVRIQNELLFIPFEKRDEIKTFAVRNGIPLRNRFNVWDGLLEPWLDTEFDEEHRKKTLASLRDHGLDEAEVLRIRGRMGWKMACYAFLALDWVSYDLWDLLMVKQPFVLGRGAFRRFYGEAMEIELRAYR